MPNIVDDDDDRAERRPQTDRDRQKSDIFTKKFSDKDIEDVVRKVLLGVLREIGIRTDDQISELADNLSWLSRQRKAQEARQGKVVGGLITSFFGLLTAAIVGLGAWVLAHWPRTP